jgi:pimeloyl-ACP methyl ester carboxylesterase
MLSILLAFAVSLTAKVASAPATEASRHDFRVTSDPGVSIFVREVGAFDDSYAKAPLKGAILLIHGARVPGLASFDLDVPGGSLAVDLAQRGFVVYVMDIRGYGASTRPKEMDEAPSAHPPLVRSNEVARDIGAVVEWIKQRRRLSKVALFGWATGGQWAGYYASLHPENVSALILVNSLYGGSSKHALLGHGSDSEDPAHPGRFNQASCGAYRFNTAASLFEVWDRSIPEADKTLWRDPVVAKAFEEAALASDPTSNSRTPPSFRSPCGAFEDSFYLATGRQLWDASLITSPTLILTSERDFWSRPEDRQTLAEHLVHARKVRVVVIPNATHFVHLDRPERGRNQLLEEVTSFIADSANVNFDFLRESGLRGRRAMNSKEPARMPALL